MSQNIAESMAYIMNESGGDFSSARWLPVQAPVPYNEHPSTHGHLTGLRNKPQKNQTSQLLAVVL